MPKPILLLTRKLPDAIEARAARDYDARLNSSDDPWSRDGTEIARRAAECGAAGILCAAGDPMGAATIEALPASVKIIATFLRRHRTTSPCPPPPPSTASRWRTRRGCYPSPPPNAPSR